MKIRYYSQFFLIFLFISSSLFAGRLSGLCNRIRVLGLQVNDWTGHRFGGKESTTEGNPLIFGPEERNQIERDLQNPGFLKSKIKQLEGESSPVLYRLANGLLAVEKFPVDENNVRKHDPAHEAYAYGLDKYLNLGVIPPIVGQGSRYFQLFIPDRAPDQRRSLRELETMDRVGTRRIRFLRNALYPFSDKLETIVDRNNKVWTIDFSQDASLRDIKSLTPERILENLPDYATYLHIKNLSRGNFSEASLLLQPLLRHWLSVVELAIQKSGTAALFPF